MTLRELQSLHVKCTGLLIAYAYANGYQLTWGETLRSVQQALDNAASGKGISNSLHLIGLAVDLHLFKDGAYLSDSKDYALLGQYWKSLHPLCAWGGDFITRPDGNHFSITYEGRR